MDNRFPFIDQNPSTAGHTPAFFDARAAAEMAEHKRILAAANVGAVTPEYVGSQPGAYAGDRLNRPAVRHPLSSFFNGA